ncbi:hypothetical protein [Aeoliella sp.]|uniref:hypothetical protein n=1 Tax=Aeoliella sp. TaxID=2795800 RepID=UPI003CCC1758
MGYEFHITRAENWFESSDTPITLNEWRDYLASDDEFRVDNYAEATTPQGQTIRIEREGIPVWTVYSKHIEGKVMSWFYYSRGCVVCKNADEEVRGKMKRVAQYFGARVVGDEGAQQATTAGVDDRSGGKRRGRHVSAAATLRVD